MTGQGPLRGRSDATRHALVEGWQVLATAPDAVADPSGLDASLAWLPVPALGPVAEVLRQFGQSCDEQQPKRLDAEDWWYRLSFDVPGLQDGEPLTLGFDGLATLAQVWLNGRLLLTSRNMFMAWQCALPSGVQARGNELVLVFRSLDQALTQRRPRPRWRAPMVEHQQLRWIRTSLLGRTPSWTPPVPAVGPWQPVWLEQGRAIDLEVLTLRPSLRQRQGWLDISVKALPLDASARIDLLALSLHRGDKAHDVELVPDQDGQTFGATLVIDKVDPWWPHTHGEPALYQATLRARLSDQRLIDLDLGSLGFRSVRVDHANGDFSVLVNEVPVFCRGASWMPLDPVTLHASQDKLTTALEQVRQAGMNMLRLAGSMVYESEDFHDACDRLGIMVWQDFMFSNMDYPGDDIDFAEQVSAEASQQLRRWQARPSLAVLCGNSEVEQQAAMWAAPRDRWQPPLFHKLLARLAVQLCPDVPYWPSSAHGGAFPHQGDVGTTSYYGVGVYLRPLEDARRSNVRFATECLGLANEPEHPTVRRVPNDPAIGGNFEDVRDHYLAQLFKVEPAQLRSADPERYLTLSRVTSAEVMAATFNEWRRGGSSCRGGLVWFLRDVWPGAGFGLMDSEGLPKSCYHALKRVLQPVSVFFSDEGCNGLYVHVGNERPHALQASLDITAYRADGMSVGQGSKPVALDARGTTVLSLMDWFDWFIDLSHAYRFGPPSAEVVVASLIGEQGELLSQAFSFPVGLALERHADIGLSASARQRPDGVTELTVSTAKLAQSVHFKVDGHVPDDAYFHLAPGASRTVLMRPVGDASTPLSGSVLAINADAVIPIELKA